MKTRVSYTGKAYFDENDYTNRAIVTVGPYIRGSRGVSAAMKKVQKMFPDAWACGVEEIRESRIDY